MQEMKYIFMCFHCASKLEYKFWKTFIELGKERFSMKLKKMEEIGQSFDSVCYSSVIILDLDFISNVLRFKTIIEYSGLNHYYFTGYIDKHK
ncbi:LOW QUALITY PROTEIN: hypothetical protein KUTeg_001596 [Tegillarca granosa]|uniref:Uncharacterized protein n=1 Tax=Tegillarca granosa TaxID=220873 RepID=A0ABQ9FRW4_TEGGR|nr:LOW QUALITY PROTEIN: hypothetical protein KUTeg_001596 [Tegillarca granosa]